MKTDKAYIKALEQAIIDANDWLQAQEGINLTDLHEAEEDLSIEIIDKLIARKRKTG